MLDVKSLRIGNIILYESTHTLSRVVEISTGEIMVTDGDEALWIESSKFIPVTITEGALVANGFVKIECATKHGNGADWLPEYPRSEYYAYQKHSFTVVFESWCGIEGGCVENNIGIYYGDFYPDFVDSSDRVHCSEKKYLHELQNIFYAIEGRELF